MHLIKFPLRQNFWRSAQKSCDWRFRYFSINTQKKKKNDIYCMYDENTNLLLTA